MARVLKYAPQVINSPYETQGQQEYIQEILTRWCEGAHVVATPVPASTVLSLGEESRWKQRINVMLVP